MVAEHPREPERPGLCRCGFTGLTRVTGDGVSTGGGVRSRRDPGGVLRDREVGIEMALMLGAEETAVSTSCDNAQGASC